MPTYTQNLASEVLAKDVYRFSVKEAHTHYSKQGNEMIELKLAVGNLIVFDRLVFTENAYWKIDQFRIAVGEKLGPPGSSVDIEPEDLIGLSGMVLLDTEEYNGKQKNIVVEYCDPALTKPKEQTQGAASGATKKSKKLDLVSSAAKDPDDIPF